MPPRRWRDPHAGVAELADALDSKSSVRKDVPVQVRPPVLVTPQSLAAFFCAPMLATDIDNTPKTLHGPLTTYLL
jgi:hypothetical protein